MACYHPIPAYQERPGTPVTFAVGAERENANTTINCGKCLGCRTMNQLQWTHRQIHEARLWDNNRFVTLTYDDEHLPRELVPTDLQKFLKRLRKHAETTNSRVQKNPNGSIRYLACGEYGEKTERPHYHLNIFNFGMEDEKKYSEKLSESETLNTIWGKGTAKLATFSGATAGYVAGYITKTGNKTYADENGEIRHPPFRRSSSRPAIGKSWLDKYATDLQHGYLVAEGGTKTAIPRYYTKKLLEMKEHKMRTEDNLNKEKIKTDKNTTERLKDQEIIHKQHISKKSRASV